MREDIKLIEGDCLEELKNIPDNSIDLIVTDPPYLINYCSSWSYNKNNIPILNDTNYKLIGDVIKEMYRILKNDSAAYIFCSSKTVDFFMRECKTVGFNIKNNIVWIKNNWTAGDLQAQFGCQYEVILLLNKGRKKINGKRLSDVWYFDRISYAKQLHQNQKPIGLLEQCIEKHSNENDIVLDCFMGSGSTGVACKNLNRKFIGIELDKKYFNIAKERIENMYEE